MAPDGVGEVRHTVCSLVDVGRERGVGPPDVERGRSLQARQRAGHLVPYIQSTYSLENAAEAYADLEQRRTMSAIPLNP